VALAVVAAGGVLVEKCPNYDMSTRTTIDIPDDLFGERRVTLVTEPYLLIEAKVQNVDNVIHVLARRLERLKSKESEPRTPAMSSHNFK
jgi:hypothetical protein